MMENTETARHAIGLEAVSMTKRFGQFAALDGVSLKVAAGSRSRASTRFSVTVIAGTSVKCW